MKRAWIAVGLIALSLILGGVEYLYVTTAANVYTEMLNEADEHMEKNEAYEVQSITERLDHRFNEDAGMLDMVSFHSEINAVSYDLASLRRYAQTGNTADYLALSAQVKRKILTLSDLRSPRLENIF